MLEERLRRYSKRPQDSLTSKICSALYAQLHVYDSRVQQQRQQHHAGLPITIQQQQQQLSIKSGVESSTLAGGTVGIQPTLVGNYQAIVSPQTSITLSLSSTTQNNDNEIQKTTVAAMQLQNLKLHQQTEHLTQLQSNLAKVQQDQQQSNKLHLPQQRDCLKQTIDVQFQQLNNNQPLLRLTKIQQNSLENYHKQQLKLNQLHQPQTEATSIQQQTLHMQQEQQLRPDMMQQDLQTPTLVGVIPQSFKTDGIRFQGMPHELTVSEQILDGHKAALHESQNEPFNKQNNHQSSLIVTSQGISRSPSAVPQNVAFCLPTPRVSTTPLAPLTKSGNTILGVPSNIASSSLLGNNALLGIPASNGSPMLGNNALLGIPASSYQQQIQPVMETCFPATNPVNGTSLPSALSTSSLSASIANNVIIAPIYVQFWPLNISVF